MCMIFCFARLYNNIDYCITFNNQKFILFTVYHLGCEITCYGDSNRPLVLSAVKQGFNVCFPFAAGKAALIQ